jgi:hypothetical protein
MEVGSIFATPRHAHATTISIAERRGDKAIKLMDQRAAARSFVHGVGLEL